MSNLSVTSDFPEHVIGYTGVDDIRATYLLIPDFKGEQIGFLQRHC